MAIKALCILKNFDPESDGTYRCRLDIWSGTNNAANVLNDAFFSATALAATVNAALRAFVEGYIQTEWEVDFNPVLDSVKMLNPIAGI